MITLKKYLETTRLLNQTGGRNPIYTQTSALPKKSEEYHPDNVDICLKHTYHQNGDMTIDQISKEATNGQRRN